MTDHAPHPRTEMEWWSTFATFPALGSLFVCVWRYRGPGFSQPGHMASHALVDPAGVVESRRALIDRPMLVGARQALRRALALRQDPLLQTVLELTDDGCVFAPYQLVDAAPHDERTLPTVGDHGVAGRDGGACLRFELGAGRSLSVPVAEPAVWFGADRGYQAGDRRMQGYGIVADDAQLAWDGQRHTGRAFFGHHWGPWALFGADAFYFHPEWQFFQLQLSDGRALFVRFDQRPHDGGRRLSTSFALLREPAGSVIGLERVELSALSEHESLRTGNRYDRAFRLAIPALSAELEVHVGPGDHELPVFAPHRGVFEAPCTVSGSIDGVVTAGVGHAEIFGRSPDINEFFWGKRKSHLTAELERFVPRTHSPAFMQRVCRSTTTLALDSADVEHALLRPIWSMMDRGGKGWRSTWLMLCCHALGDEKNDERVRPFLPIIELLHTGSLIIDDIQDESPIRRGRPALHVEVGVDLAINVGSFLYFLPQLIVEEADWLTPAQQADIYRHINIALRQGHVGQAMDLMWAKRDRLSSSVENLDRTRDELLTQYRLKSGCQLEAIARIAGTLSSAPTDRTEALARYAREFGVAFQIADDILDTQDAFDKLGKESGEDFANGKLNVVLLYALARTDPTTRARLCEMMGAGRGATDLGLLRRVVAETGAVEYATAEAEGLLDGTFAPLLAQLPLSEHVVVMRSVPRWLLQKRAAQ